MQEKNFDVWSSVDESNFRKRAWWIVGTLISLMLLILSFAIESGILVLLDGVLPLSIIIYGIIKKNSNVMTHEQNQTFRDGAFYKALVSKRYDNRKTNLKKIYIKWNIYRILK